MSANRANGLTRLVSAGRTDTGRQRKHNEDHVLVRPELDLFVVADGMGGHNAGDVASKLTTTSLDNFFLATKDAPVPFEPAEDEVDLSPEAHRLVAAIRKANRDVFEISSTMRQHQGMGSTVVAAHVERNRGFIHIGHVGDSRCYRIRDGEIELLTRDHSLVNDALAIKPDLSEEELARLPRNIITRALGMKDQVKVDLRTEALLPGDTFLLCSDGLSGMVNEHQILEAFHISDEPPEICELLVAMANDAGGSDNITAVIFRAEEVTTPELEVSDADLEIDVPNVDTALPPETLELLAGGAEIEIGSTPPPAPPAPPAPRAPPAPVAPPASVAVAVVAAVATAAPAPKAVAARGPESGKLGLDHIPVARCRRCDTELIAGNVFCVECGARIDA